MAYVNNAPTMYIYTKGLQIKCKIFKKDRKSAKRVNDTN